MIIGDIVFDSTLKKSKGKVGAESKDKGSIPKKEHDDIVKELRKSVDDLNAQIKEKDEQVLRVHADFDNFRKRNEKRIEEIKLDANKDLIVELFDVVDNFERALVSSGDSGDMGDLKDGFSQIYKKLMGILESFGLEQIECIGKKFDPECHDAVGVFESDEHEHDIIVDEMCKGYTLNDKVIRFPKVRVAKRLLGESSGEDVSGKDVDRC